MARKFTIEILMDLATSIGANPQKFMGTKTNISFLGKGPVKNPLFQNPLTGLEGASEASLGSREALIGAVEDAMGFVSSGKLNSIQTEILGQNLLGIKNIIKPPVLPSASVTPIRSGITTLRSNDIGAGPRRYNELTGLNRPRGVKGSTSIGPVKGRSYSYIDEQGNTRIMPSKEWSDKAKSMLPEPGPGDMAAFTGALDQKTGMSRAIARNLLLKDTRLKIEPEDLFMLKEGKGEPLDMMKKYYGESMLKYDDFLNQVDITAARPDEFAEMILKNVRLVPEFAEGGLADIMQTPRRGYAQGIGPVGEGKSFPTNSKMPQIDPYELFFRHQNKLMFDDEMKRRGLARILEV